ncbi:MAG: S8 family serine peptidase [Magnetospirillum sp.]|nr:S8 family serine peptidase [Magnetospirillum sp.]
MMQGWVLRGALALAMAAVSATAMAADMVNLKSAGGASAAGLLAAKAAKGGARVIVTLAAEPEAAPKGGAMPLEDYIDSLQTRTLQSLGWVNFNDIVRYEFSPAMAMAVDGPRLQQLMSSNRVAGVYEDRMNTLFLADSVPAVGGAAARAAGIGGKGMTVAVIDSGVDSAHPFLKGKVVAEACFSTAADKAVPKMVATCPGGSGREIGPGAARPCLAESCAHGTHVAGIVAGKGPDFTGVAPEAEIIAAQVFSIYEDPVAGKVLGSATSDLLRALEWVYSLRDTHRIAAVNLSLGGGQFRHPCDAESQPYVPIFKLLREAGIAVVVAAGNESFTDSLAAPACLSSAISVGASDRDDAVASFSNSANFLSLLAPGIDRAAGGRGINSSVPGGRFERMPGTSMAAPHVAGAFAALRSAMPTASVEQMLAALKGSGKPVRDPRNGISVPRIQVDGAASRLVSGGGHAAPPRPAEPAPPRPAEPAPPPPQADPAPVPPPQAEPPRRDVPRKPVPRQRPGDDDDGIGRW